MKRGILFLIRWYKRHLSPHLPDACRFTPTCSQYALTAIERYGAWKGGWMALWRILRCTPFARGGYDPVPEDTNATMRRE